MARQPVRSSRSSPLVRHILFQFCFLLVAPVVVSALHGLRVVPAFNLGSATCAACRSSTPSVCPLRSGLFTRPQLRMGANQVATIPWGACNVNVSEMAPSFNRLALRTTREGRYILNSPRGTPAWNGEHPAAGTTFLYSNGGTHQGETLWAPGPLTEPLDIVIVGKQPNPGIHYQYHLPVGFAIDRPTSRGLPLTETTATNVGNVEVASWKLVGYTACSRSCGGGEQRSMFACMRGPHVTVPHSHCDSLPKPEENTIRCGLKPCPARWEAEEWSQCSVTCGEGEQTRVVTCRQMVSSHTIKVTDGLCPGVAPERSRGCLIRHCTHEDDMNDPEWTVSEWEPCNATCGNRGVQSRRVWCSQGEQGLEMPEVQCHNQERPEDVTECDGPPCSSSSGATWLFTEWGNKCSSSCGPGTERRRVQCLTGDIDNNEVGIVDHSGSCHPHDRPSDSRPCYRDTSCGAAWFHGPWDQCPDTCNDAEGPSHQSRNVVCVQNRGGQSKVVQDTRCAGLEKPSHRRPCPPRDGACSNAVWFFSDWGPCMGSCGAGHHRREVRCMDTKYKTISMDCPEERRPKATERCEPDHCAGNEHDGGDSPSEIPRRAHAHSKGGTLVPGCHDLVEHCKAAMQARLCELPFFQTSCCNACSRYTADRHRESRKSMERSDRPA